MMRDWVGELLFHKEAMRRPYDLPVAKATIQTTNPRALVEGTALGRQCCEVVNYVMKRDAILPRPYGNINIMADAIGQSIAWPHENMISSDENAARVSQVHPGHVGLAHHHFPSC